MGGDRKGFSEDLGTGSYLSTSNGSYPTDPYPLYILEGP